jgi:hypothetical protein
MCFADTVSTPLRSHPLESGLGAIGLFVLSLAFLFIGNFIQFDDTSGFGSNEWLVPFGFLAFLAATASLVVAFPMRPPGACSDLPFWVWTPW